MTNVQKLVSAYSLSDRIMMWSFASYLSFFGFILTDSALEQMGVIPNLVINSNAFGNMHLFSMYPMLSIGLTCLAGAIGILWLATMKQAESK